MAATTCFWDDLNPKVTLPNDDKVLTEQYLASCRQILPMFDKLGKAFYPVKKDVDGNLTVLQKKFASNPEKCQTIKDMLQDEFDNGMKVEKPTQVALSCLWLTRALSYITTFLKYLCEDYRSGNKVENICGFVTQAYEETLKKYHGWLTVGVFSLVARACPYRKDFLRKLCNENESLEEKCYTAMEEFVKNLTANIVVIGAHLKEFGLDSDKKV